ncbi:MAG: hypothetical protein ACTHL8_05400 [Burkholderiaceae bacterium]
MQVVLDRAAMAKRLHVTERKLAELIKQGRVPQPQKWGHRTHRWVIDHDTVPLLPSRTS